MHTKFTSVSIDGKDCVGDVSVEGRMIAVKK
jgi:hypothetical protein